MVERLSHTVLSEVINKSNGSDQRGSRRTGDIVFVGSAVKDVDTHPILYVVRGTMGGGHNGKLYCRFRTMACLPRLSQADRAFVICLCKCLLNDDVSD